MTIRLLTKYDNNGIFTERSIVNQKFFQNQNEGG